MENFLSGIRNKHPGPATLLILVMLIEKLILVEQALGNLALAEANYLRALQLRQEAQDLILSLEIFLFIKLSGVAISESACTFERVLNKDRFGNICSG